MSREGTDDAGRRRPDDGRMSAQATAARVGRTLIQRMVIFPAVGMVCRPRVERVCAAERMGGPLVVVANHTSHLDCPVLLRALPGAVRRRTSVAAAADYFYRTRVRGAAVSLALGTMPFDRKVHTGAALDACRGVLTSGGALLMFPEGTRSRDGVMAAFKSGAARVAIDTGAAVLPVGVSGLHAVLPVGASMPHPRRVSVHVGAPLYPSDGESVKEFTSRIENAVRRLCGQDQVR
jgi:1-acyl-sn-glycerol-3-phosphate acyltransferase